MSLEYNPKKITATVNPKLKEAVRNLTEGAKIVNTINTSGLEIETSFSNIGNEIESVCDEINRIETQINNIGEDMIIAENKNDQTVDMLNRLLRTFQNKENDSEKKQVESLLNKIASVWGKGITYAYAISLKTDKSNLNYYMVKPSSAGNGEQKPAIIYLCGDGGGSYIFTNTIVDKWNKNSENFDGYFFAVQGQKFYADVYGFAEGNDDSYEGKYRLSLFVEEIAEKYNLDKDMIVPVGFSGGGASIVRWVAEEPNLFSRVAIISACLGDKDKWIEKFKNSHVKAIGYVSNWDENETKTYMEKEHLGLDELIEVKDVAHDADAPIKILNIDSDGNGRSDIIEWCFPDISSTASNNEQEQKANIDLSSLWDSKKIDITEILNNLIKGEKTDDAKVEDTSNITSQRPSFLSKPIYSQLDYGDPYGKSTIQKGGCGITCIAQYLTSKGNTVTPPDLASKYKGDAVSGGTSSETMTQILNDYGVEVHRGFWGEGWTQGKIVDSLEEGKCVILKVSEGKFTTGGHYIMLTGVTEDGKLCVYDPNGANWDKMTEEFENGFNISTVSSCTAEFFVLD